jgi:hypothetical protein
MVLIVHCFTILQYYLVAELQYYTVPRSSPYSILIAWRELFISISQYLFQACACVMIVLYSG